VNVTEVKKEGSARVRGTHAYTAQTGKKGEGLMGEVTYSAPRDSGAIITY